MVVMRRVKVHLKSQFIMNGVCVIWRGWIDLLRLDGTARLEFDEQRASVRKQHALSTRFNSPRCTLGGVAVRASDS